MHVFALKLMHIFKVCIEIQILFDSNAFMCSTPIGVTERITAAPEKQPGIGPREEISSTRN